MTGDPLRPPTRTRRPVLGFIGNHAGRRKHRRVWPVSQNEVLAELFDQDGYTVRRASTVRNPYLRSLHHLLAISVWRRVDCLVVAVFSGRSFRMAELATAMGVLTGTRSVLFLHGGGLPEFGPQHRRRVERVFRRAEVLLAPSEYLASTFRDWGFDVRVIPNVVDLDRYEYSCRDAPRPNLLWMRTFHEHYNPLMAVRVLSEVAATHPDATMTMGGADHGLLDATKAEATRLGVDDRITFPGYMDPDHTRRAFAEHDIFLNTNVVDNMPVSVLEVSASGLVPVATAVGGIPAIIDDDHNGILVPSDDVDAMTAAVLDVLAHPERSGRLSAGARQMALRSSWPSVRSRWEEELSLVLPEFEL